MKRVAAALMVFGVAGCVGPLVEHIKVDPQEAAGILKGVTVYTPEALQGRRFTVVQPLTATSCKNKLWDPDATREDAIAQLQIKAARVTANGLTNLYCEAPTGTTLTKNCWEAIVCHGAAIKVQP